MRFAASRSGRCFRRPSTHFIKPALFAPKETGVYAIEVAVWHTSTNYFNLKSRMTTWWTGSGSTFFLTTASTQPQCLYLRNKSFIYAYALCETSSIHFVRRSYSIHRGDRLVQVSRRFRIQRRTKFISFDKTRNCGKKRTLKSLFNSFGPPAIQSAPDRKFICAWKSVAHIRP